jgi:hypothetical protein
MLLKCHCFVGERSALKSGDTNRYRYGVNYLFIGGPEKEKRVQKIKGIERERTGKEIVEEERRKKK